MPINIFCNAASQSQNTLIRPRIQHLLEKSIQKPVTTIVAGAGYGKTQAVYAFLQQYNGITVWLQLSTFDNLVTRFWEKYVYAISLQNQELALKLKSLDFPETLEAFDRFLSIVSNVLKEDTKYIFVCDDFHLIHEKNIMQFLNRIISAQIQNISIILIARNEPPIDTLGLLARDLLSTINEDTLRFSKREMIDYFQMKDIYLSPKTILDIYQYTDGWVFALNLVAVSLKKGLVHENYALFAAKENISRLIEYEIFSVMSKELQVFLVKLSLVDNLPLELIKDLSSDNPGLIEEMSKVCSFVRYDAFINTYRIHHLFLSFLAEKQATLKTSEKRNVYIRAAKWYAKNEYKIDAITFYEKAKKYDEIIKFLITYPTSVPWETADFLIGVLERISKEMSPNNSMADLLHARFLTARFRLQEALVDLLELRKKFESLPPTKENATLLCGIYSNLASVSICRGTYEFKHYFKMAYDTGCKLIKRDHVLSIINYACRVTSPAEGEFDRYIELLTDTMPYAIVVMHGAGYGYEDLARSELAYYQKDLKNAEKYALQAIYKAQQKQQYSIEYVANFYLIRINIAVGDYAEILRLINQLKEQTEKRNSSSCYTLFDIVAGWFYTLTGQIDKVANWLRDYSETRKEAITKHGFDRLVRARCCLAEKKYHTILVLFESYEDPYGFEDLVIGQIETKVLQAVALYYVHEQEQAITTLESAYNLAFPNRLDMAFIEQGNNIRGLIKAAMHSKSCTIPKQWLKAMHTKTATYAKSLSHIISEYRLSNYSEENWRLSFTNRELKLLKDLCYGLSREEMAVNGNISIHTVNSMLQIIYTKLGAANALDAVRIATLTKLVK